MLKRRDLIENKKGGVFNIFIWMIIGISILVFFGSWIFAHNSITDAIISSPAGDSVINLSDAGSKTFGVYNDKLPNGLINVAYVLLFGQALAVLLMAYFSRNHPIVFMLYIFLMIVAIIFSVYLSNTYQDLLVDPTIGSQLQLFEGGNFVMSNLPLWTTVIAILGGILMFIGIIRNDREGGV